MVGEQCIVGFGDCLSGISRKCWRWTVGALMDSADELGTRQEYRRQLFDSLDLVAQSSTTIEPISNI